MPSTSPSHPAPTIQTVPPEAPSSDARTRETAAVLALMARREHPWNRLAGAIEEAGSAAQLLEEGAGRGGDHLFSAEGADVTLAQLEHYISGLRGEGIDLVTVLDPDYPINLRMV